MPEIDTTYARLLDSYLEMSHKLEHPDPIPRDDLFARVIAAATAMGIPDVLVYEWDNQNSVSTWPTNAILRERQYHTQDKRDERHDIGYFFKKNGIWHSRSFQIVQENFNSAQYRRFQQALHDHQLEPTAYQGFRGEFYGRSFDKPNPEQPQRIPFYARDDD